MYEAWATIPFEPNYEISTLGEVRNIATKEIKSLRYNRGGYLRVTLYPSGKTYTVHQLVMRTFNPTDDNSLQVNHVDGVKEHNYIDNLEWTTVSEQALHRERMYPGLRDGERNGMSKLTYDQVYRIKYGDLCDKTNSEIAELVGVKSEQIRRIRTGERWGSV